MYRGDKILDSDNNLLLFPETATTPTALIALNIAIWYACLEERITQPLTAMPYRHSYNQNEKDSTYVILPKELWLNEWREKFKGMRLCVRLLADYMVTQWPENSDNRILNNTYSRFRSS